MQFKGRKWKQRPGITGAGDGVIVPQKTVVFCGVEKWNADHGIVLQEGDLTAAVVIHHPILVLT